MNRIFKYVTLLSFVMVVLILIKFIMTGTNDLKEVNLIFEKIATMNLALVLGYAALIAAIASLSSHNTRQDPAIRDSLSTYIYATVIYVALNVSLFITSFSVLNYSVSAGRLLIALMIISLLALSMFLLSLVRRLLY